ncbi:hypothetical protein GLOTRDRAFT_134269, partial [Gloeophyllum trabeum ATCC 11539]
PDTTYEPHDPFDDSDLEIPYLPFIYRFVFSPVDPLASDRLQLRRLALFHLTIGSNLPIWDDEPGHSNDNSGDHSRAHQGLESRVESGDDSGDDSDVDIPEFPSDDREDW